MFGFPKADHIIYKRNFLRKVIFKIDFEKKIDVLQDENFVKTTFAAKFPRFVKSQGNGIQITFGQTQPQLETLKESGSFVLKSIEGHTTLEIREKEITLIFDHTAYTSSQDVKEVLDQIVHLFRNSVDSVAKISLKKINIIEFDSSSGDSNGILYFLLNRSIIGNVDSFPNTNLISHNLQSINYKNENYYLNLKYGMNIPPVENLNIGQVIIDIEVGKYTKTQVINLDEEFQKISSEVFNVFNSLISDNFKSLLNGN